MSLKEAVSKMEQSELARELFGEAFVKHFTATRRWEMRQEDKSDALWDLIRYLEII